MILKRVASQRRSDELYICSKEYIVKSSRGSLVSMWMERSHIKEESVEVLCDSKVFEILKFIAI